MNEKLLQYLHDLGCSVINPIQKSLTDKTVVGWYCRSTSIMRVKQHYDKVEKFIKENNIDYFMSDANEATTNFSIYINKADDITSQIRNNFSGTL